MITLDERARPIRNRQKPDPGESGAENFGDLGVGILDERVSFTNINNIFYEDLFTILIVVDVFMFLISFFYTGSFHKVIWNSGFIISTVLIRLSFLTEGPLKLKWKSLIKVPYKSQVG